MIQRIQTIYLFAAVIFMLLFYLFPIAIFTTEIFSFEFFNCHITHPENLKPNIPLFPLAVLPVLSMLTSFIAIFLYKNRKLQMRLGKVNMFLVFTILAVTVVYFIKLKNLLDGSVQYGFSAIFPILSFVSIVLANRAINSDEKLIKAADRIR